MTVPGRIEAPIARAETESVSARLRFRNAGARRGERWLFRQLDLELSAGQLIAVTGPSGTGKSSLLACIGGALALEEGRIENLTARSRQRGEAGAPSTVSASFDSTPGTSRAGARRSPRDIGAAWRSSPHVDGYESGIAPAWVFQDLRLVPQATLLANVLMARLGRYRWWQTLWSFPPAERRAALAQLHELETGHLALRAARETSGGEQQRAAVARALFAGAPLLLADEPVANLNEELAGCVLQRLRCEAREHGALVICVLHHEDQVRQFADAALRLSPEFPNGWQWEDLR